MLLMKKEWCFDQKGKINARKLIAVLSWQSWLLTAQKNGRTLPGEKKVVTVALSDKKGKGERQERGRKGDGPRQT